MVHVAIIGAYGSAGVAAAERLLEARDAGELVNLELSLIDDGDPPGGLCILRGCMPSKDVLSAGAHRFQARHDSRLDGVTEVDPTKVIDRKNRHVNSFAEHRRAGVEQLADREEVTLYRERGTFVDAHTLKVGDERIEFDYVIVATGSNPFIPPIPGMDDINPKTSADVLEMTDFPDRAIVVGFGFIGLELVPYLVEVGDTEVTVIDRNERPLGDADPTFGETVVELYRDLFDVEVVTAAEASGVRRTKEAIELTYTAQGEEGTTSGDELFVFTGRSPNVEGLGLETIGVDTVGPLVTETMQTIEQPHVLIAGDANGHEPILHVAKEEGITAARNVVRMANDDQVEPYEPLTHRIVFSGLGVYPFARLGHTEASARAADINAISVKRHASDDGVFKTKDVPAGLAKLVVDGDSRRVIGYQGLHHHADVFAKTMQIVIELGLRVDELPDRAYHPTTPEMLDGLIREASERLATV